MQRCELPPYPRTTYLSKQPSAAADVETSLAFQPLPGALRELAFAVLVAALERPLGLIVRVQRDLLADELDALRIHAVQQPELAGLVPPVLAQLGEVRDLVGVDRVQVAPQRQRGRHTDGARAPQRPRRGRGGSYRRAEGHVGVASRWCSLLANFRGLMSA